MFNQINEEIKESFDKQDAKLKQREEDVGESLQVTEAKYFPDLDIDSDLDQSKDQSKELDSDSDLNSSDDIVYVNKPEINTNKFKCEACNQELTQKNYSRHNQSLRHKKHEKVYNRNKIIESANEGGIKVTSEDIEQKIGKQYPELEGVKYCDSCDMYIDNNTEYNKQIETLKHRDNVRLFSEEIIKNGSKFEYVTCKSTLSQYSVDQHLKTKMHLDNVEGKDKDKDKDNNITEDI